MLEMVSVWISATELIHSRSLLGLQDNQMELEVCCEEVWTSICLMDRIKMLMGNGGGSHSCENRCSEHQKGGNSWVTGQ